MYRLPRAITLRQQQLVGPRTFRLSQRKSVSQIAYRQNGEAVRYQAVRFKKPSFFSWKRTATVSLYASAFYLYWTLVRKHLSLEIEILEEMEDEEEDGEEVEGEDDGLVHPDSLFIPMTWAKKQPRTFYRGSDEEWKEFIKIAKDKQRQVKIHKSLLDNVHKAAASNPGVIQRIGKDIQMGKYWLDIQFPDGPPEDYLRSGIEIGDGYIAWSQQKITQQDQFRLDRAFYPKAVFESLYATSTMLLGINYRRIKQAFGWEEKDPLSPEERFRLALEVMEKQKAAKEKKSFGKSQTEPDATPGAVVGGGSGRSAKSPADGEKKLKLGNVILPLPGEALSAASGQDSKDIPIEVPVAMHVFRSTLAKNWASGAKLEPPRGNFVVQGMVEIKGERGRFLFDVQSFYDPKESKFTLMGMKARNFKRWQQAPRGGP